MDKTIRLLKLLSGSRSYDLEELKDRFEVSERTVYRYLNQIENGGFVIDRTNGGYRLVRDSSSTKTLYSLFHFSEEEAQIFYHSLENLDLENEVVRRLLKKLHSLYDFKALKRGGNSSNVEKVELLSEGMRQKKQVLLCNYHSSNSSTVNDRRVEPFQFMEDYKAIWCLDIADRKVKQFKVSRAEEVKVLESAWFYEHVHEIPFFDAFRMSAPEPIAWVRALLSLKAYNLMREEYPLTQQYLKKKSNFYELKIPIADYHGIGRFVMGLPGDVKVFEPVEFKEFINDKMKKVLTYK